MEIGIEKIPDVSQLKERNWYLAGLGRLWTGAS